MKLRFLIFETKSPDWVSEARDVYGGKIGPFQNFEIRLLKSPSGDRDQADVKRSLEAKVLFKELSEKDLLILFDEKGRIFPTSEEFAKNLGKILDSGKSNVVFCIGGPYGFAPEVVARSQHRWSLSGLTMNHWVAQIAALEQLYRGLTILKGIPYHNR